MFGKLALNTLVWTTVCTLWVSPLMADSGDSFSFVVIADPHVRASHYTQNKRRLEQCVDWVNAHRLWADIRLVFVAGDIGWDTHEGGMIVEETKAILDGLNVPYVPIIGDDDVRFGRDGYDFSQTFEPVYQRLAELADDPTSGFSNFQKAPVRVDHPGGYGYFHNFAFEYGGVQFVCPDWCSRDGSTSILGTRDDDGDLHDFAGGTWPWFTRTLADCPKDKRENIVIMAHNPMLTLKGSWLAGIAAGALTFDHAEFAKLSAFLGDPAYNYGDHIHAAYSGHLHFRAYVPENADPGRIELPDWLEEMIAEKIGRNVFVPLPGYDLHSVQATHFPDPPFGPPTHPEDEVQIELVTVTEGEDAFSYVSAPILVPWFAWTVPPPELGGLRRTAKGQPFSAALLMAAGLCLAVWQRTGSGAFWGAPSVRGR